MMEVFNTLGRTRQVFEPRDPGVVTMYVCGPTVQTSPHLGHGRAAVVFDVIRRYLEWEGFEVTYVQNVTDVDDKIINAAAERGIDCDAVAAASFAEFDEGYRKLGVKAPTIEPRATEHIPEMIDMIESLIASDHAYASGGDVYFSVRSFPEYGKLSGRRIDELESGARIDPGEHKQDPLDFALWKAAKPGEPSWDSPWGPGRPGWHIECSAMSRKYLGGGFDIHAGGIDLIFPHHENEVAQAEAAHPDAPFCRYWLHNGMVNLAGEKMAKSTGHVVGLLDALETYPPTAVRLFYLRTHYRKPVEFTPEAMDDAVASLERLWAFRRRVTGPVEAPPDEQLIDRFRAVMGDDFDVAGALGVIFDAVREGNRLLDAGEDPGGVVAAFDEMTAVLNLPAPDVGLGDVADGLVELAGAYGIEAGSGDEDLVDALVAARQSAKTAKEWDTADAIRDGLAALGVVVEDTPDGARWHRR
ncbi:MAG: cysteine--tRNA ligase [Acidimicrobiia bacterium]|nr:cysteine--tRNA ligase [Acidimicrobiia bacterium]